MKSGWHQVLMKLAAVAVVPLLWWRAYDAVNAYASDPVRTIHLSSPASIVPWIIQPWTAVIYVLGGAIFPVAPFLYHRSWRGIAFVMACVTTTSLLSFAIYCVWPVSMVRPEFSDDSLGERLMRWVFSVDEPANCFPSSHVFFSGALLIGRAGAGGRARWFWWTFAVAVSLTTVTSGQHYFIDVPGGAVVAWLGYTAGLRLVPPGRPLRIPSARTP